MGVHCHSHTAPALVPCNDYAKKPTHTGQEADSHRHGHHGCAQALWRAQDGGVADMHLWIPLRMSAGSVSDAKLWLKCAEALADIKKIEEGIMLLLANEAPSTWVKEAEEADDTWELAGVQPP